MKSARATRSLAFIEYQWEEVVQSLKLALRQPWVWSGSDLIFLASAYEGG